MSYTKIDKELNISACSVEDLSLKLIRRFLTEWNDNKPIRTLTLFYDGYTGEVILNRNHPLYETNLEITKDYLSDPTMRNEVYPWAYTELIRALDVAISIREKSIA